LKQNQIERKWVELGLQQLLERLQSCDECQRIEAKESKSTLGSSALETISAFSNEPDLGGGYLVLGLKKNDQGSATRYSIVGVENPDKIQCELATLAASAFNFQIRPEIKVESVKGKSLIIAFITESFCREKPVFIKKYGEERGAF
jgi:ATP-dependent DNA helicase RecG